MLTRAPVRILFLGWLLTISTPAQAQYPTSTISGSVRTEDGSPVPNVAIRWIQNGQSVSLIADNTGEFIFHFVTPGQHDLAFEHPSTREIGHYQARMAPDTSLRLAVTLHPPYTDGDGENPWKVERLEVVEESAWQPESVLTASQLESLPSTEHLWALLNHTEASVVAERFDISGLHSQRQLLLGVRGSSWAQNQASLNGLSVTHSAGDGMLVFPDLTSMEAIILAVGDSPTQHTGAGAHLALLSKTGGRELHGQSEMFFQCGALQNTNASDRFRFFRITESDERWKHFESGGFQLGGALGRRPWHYFGAISGRDIEKKIRNQSSPVSARLGQGTFNLSGPASSKDSVGFYGSAQRLHEPQAGASPQVTREASIDLIQAYYTGQVYWTRFLSARSLLDVRFGMSRRGENSRVQPYSLGQSQEDLFPGYALAGLPDSPSPWDMLAMLNDTVRGPARFAVSGNADSTEGTAVYSTVRPGLGHLDHRITLGMSIRRIALTQGYSVVDDVNLLFFEGNPNSVRLLDGPARTRDRIHQIEWHASDTFSLARLTMTLGISLDSSQGRNRLNNGHTANTLRWTNLGGRIGAAYRVLKGGRLVLRAGVAQINDQPLASTWTAVNPDGLGIRLYSWADTNRDRQFQAGENSQLLKVSGAPYTSMDPRLRNPATTETTLGFSLKGPKGVSLQFFGFHRSEHRLISLVNAGVPISAYTPVQVADPGRDGEVGTTDDGFITVFNQKSETLGQDRYLLTNPDGLNAYAQGLELRLSFSSRRIQAQGTLTRFRDVASTAPGISARQNDTNSYQGIFDDPNNAILARGSAYFDRGSLGRLWTAVDFPRRIKCSLILSYQDGAPFGRYLPVQGLNQGVIGVLTEQRGPGASGTPTGPRTRFSITADMRVYRDFSLRRGSLVMMLDIFNLTNRSNALEETPVTAPTEYWRIPLRFETPRSLQLGIRYKW